MRSQERKEKSVGSRVAILGASAGLALLFSLGVVGGHAASSKPRASAAVQAPKVEASAATAQSNEIPGQYDTHAEYDLQLD